MSLTIGKLATRCELSRRSAARAHEIERVVRHDFVAACRRTMSRHLPRRPEVVRIRRVKVRVTHAGRFDAEKLARTWAEMVAREVVTGLAGGGGNRIEIVCADTRTDWLVRVVGDVLAGAASGRWEYEEFGSILASPCSAAVLALFAAEPAQIVPVLVRLESARQLERLLARLDTDAVDRLLWLMTPDIAVAASAITLDDLVSVGRAAKDAGVSAFRSDAKSALRLFVRMAALEAPIALARPPHFVLRVLRVLDVLAELALPADPAEWIAALEPDAVARRLGPPANDGAAAAIDVIRRLAVDATDGGSVDVFDTLSTLLDEIGSPAQTRADDGPATDAIWYSSDVAGLLLLTGLVDRLDWPNKILGTSLGARYGPRALTYCLAGLGLASLDHPMESETLEPGVALFAGWIVPTHQDVGGFHRFLASTTHEDRRELLAALAVIGAEAADASTDWARTFEAVATTIAHELAVRVRGFRNADRRVVAKSFLTRPGLLRVSERRILVVLSPSPFHVALRISTMDETVSSVGWLGGRRVEFQLEGL